MPDSLAMWPSFPIFERYYGIERRFERPAEPLDEAARQPVGAGSPAMRLTAQLGTADS